MSHSCDGVSWVLKIDQLNKLPQQKAPMWRESLLTLPFYWRGWIPFWKGAPGAMMDSEASSYGATGFWGASSVPLLRPYFLQAHRWFPWAAVTNRRGLGGTEHRNGFSLSSGGQKSVINTSAGLCSTSRRCGRACSGSLSRLLVDPWLVRAELQSSHGVLPLRISVPFS